MWCIYNFHHNEKYGKNLGKEAFGKRWRHTTEPGKSRLHVNSPSFARSLRYFDIADTFPLRRLKFPSFDGQLIIHFSHLLFSVNSFDDIIISETRTGMF